VYYANGVENAAVTGTSATYAQVAVGVMGGLHAWLGGLPKGINFTEELRNSAMPAYVFANLKTERHVFTKNDRGLQLASHDRWVRR
jgi:hypothetical protein